MNITQDGLLNNLLRSDCIHHYEQHKSVLGLKTPQEELMNTVKTIEARTSKRGSNSVANFIRKKNASKVGKMGKHY